MRDLGESGCLEDAAAPDVELSPGDVLAGLCDHRIALERACTTFPRELDGGAGERVADTAAPIARARDEAGNRPDGVVRLVLGPTRPVAP